MIVVENHPVQNSFARSTRGWGGIYVINYDGSSPRYLADGWDPVWTPDGTKVLYTQRDGNGATAAKIVRADGRRTDHPTTLLTFNGHFSNTPELANNGSVVFAGGSSSSDGDDLYLRGTDDKSPHRIALPSRFASISEPRFTADENAITFLAVMSEDYDNGRDALTSGWKINIDGTGLTRMTPQNNQVYAPGAAGTELYTTAASQYQCVNYNSNGNCNGYAVLGGTLMVANNTGADLRSLGVGDVTNPARDPSPAPTAQAAQVRGPGSKECRVSYDTVGGAQPVEPDYEHWHEARRRWTITANLFCGELATEVTGSMCLRVELEPRNWARTCSGLFTAPLPRRANPKQFTFRYTCGRPATGATRFEVVAQGETLAGLEPGDPPKPAIYRLVPDGRPLPRMTCPSDKDYRDHEAVAWRHLSKTPFDCGSFDANIRHTCWENERSSDPGYFLASTLKANINPSNRNSSPPAWPKYSSGVSVGGWDAHHVIPARESFAAAALAQSIGFRCHIHPNQTTNGIYLRARSGDLRNYSTVYNEQIAGSRYSGRVEHWRYDQQDDARYPNKIKSNGTWTRAYSGSVATAMAGEITSDGDCRSPQRALSKLHSIVTEQLDNNYIPGIGANP
jgi:hypothetical protein